MDTKTCTKCGITKELSEFCKDKSKKDGKETRCRECKKKCSAEWRLRNRERDQDGNLERHKAYRLANRTKIKRARRRYYIKNRSILLNKTKEWCEKNKEHMKEYRTLYRKGQVENMSDTYIKHLLCQNSPLEVHDIPSDLIHFKCEQLEIRRAARQLLNAIQDKQNADQQ